MIFGLNRLLTNIKIIGGLRNRKPELLKKIIKGYCKAWLINKASLRFMDIALDYNCNFSCQHFNNIPNFKIALRQRSAGNIR